MVVQAGRAKRDCQVRIETAGSVVPASSCQVKMLPRPALASAVDGRFSMLAVRSTPQYANNALSPYM